MNFKNSDGSEFSAEDHGLQYVYPVIMVLFAMTLSGNISRLARNIRKTENIEPNLLILNVAIGCQLSAIFFKVVHLWFYVYNGKGLIVFDIMHQMLDGLSLTIISILFILIASGWTIKYKDPPDIDIYAPISLLVAILNVFIIGISRAFDDSHYKYTAYEGVPGFCFVLLRVLLWVWFIYLVKELQKGANENIVKFLYSFVVVVSVYFLIFPVIVVFSWAFEPHFRNKVVVLLTNLAQVLVFIFLTHLFSGRSTFYKISTLSGSVLPGKK